MFRFLDCKSIRLNPVVNCLSGKHGQAGGPVPIQIFNFHNSNDPNCFPRQLKYFISECFKNKLKRNTLTKDLSPEKQFNYVENLFNLGLYINIFCPNVLYVFI